MSNPSTSSGAGSSAGSLDAGLRQLLLRGVAQALRVLADRLVPQTDAMRDVYDFVVRAEEATVSRELSGSMADHAGGLAQMAARSDLHDITRAAAAVTLRAGQAPAVFR